jgi:hypothetical protein
LKEIHTEIEIHAPAQRVWTILTDIGSYPGWNPFIRWGTGEATVGTKLQLVIQPSGGRGMKFRPKVLVADPNRELRWLGQLWVAGLFDGEHSFSIEPLSAAHVRFTQRERFSGLLVPLLSQMLDRDIRSGFEEMNRALKARAESAL